MRIDKGLLLLGQNGIIANASRRDQRRPGWWKEAEFMVGSELDPDEDKCEYI